jgi:OmpA-OmpF porin, OOP family
MKKTLSGVFAVAALAFASTGAMAQTSSNAYLGVSVGASHADFDCTGTTACDNSGVDARVRLGFRVVPNVAVEAHFAALGKSTATIPFAGSSVDGTIKGRSVGVGVAGFVPFGASWSGVARIGVASNRTSIDVSGAGISGSDSETRTEPYFGLGVNYAISSNVDLGVAWDATRLSYGGEKATVNAFSAVATFKF